MARSRRDAAHGAVLGALVGDAAGAVLEFLGHVPTERDVARALAFPGGGCWRVGPGQITDDGELTICLLRGLVEGAGDHDRNAVARWYGRWYLSPPFDIGGTTATALGVVSGAEGLRNGVAARMATAAQASMGSKANGSLMRSTPLAVFANVASDDEIFALARDDSSLTHPNRSCVDAVALYCGAIAHLVNHPGDEAGALARARRMAASAEEEVRGWLALADAGEHVPAEPMMGFVKIAFAHAFRLLGEGATFERAIAETLALGGDTDTNACIVGGLVGAAVGASGIPEAWRAAVLERDPAVGRPRPEFLWTAEVPELVDALLAARPLAPTVWHVCRRAEWEAGGEYVGSSQDVADGFIHCSTTAQVRESVAKHRAGQDGLVALEIDARAVGAGLRWEESRRGALFPHIYGALPREAVVAAHPLPLGEDGRHHFPEAVPGG